MTVYATTDIPSGSEINIEYQAALIQKTRSKRREQLYEAFGFTCACSACAPASEELVQASDARRSEIDTLVGRLRDDGANKKRAEVFAGMKRLKGLLQDEGYKASEFLDVQYAVIMLKVPQVPEFNDSSVSKAFAFWSSTAPDA